MMVYDEDVEQCLYYLENGEDFTFVVVDDTLCQFNDMRDHNSANIHITLTPEWYELVYCASCWDRTVLKKELDQFGKAAG
jgi:hypothetical protein